MITITYKVSRQRKIEHDHEGSTGVGKQIRWKKAHDQQRTQDLEVW